MLTNPTEIKQPRESRWIKILFWTALISSWPTCVLFATMPLGFLFWLIVLAVLSKRKTKFKKYLVLYSAWTVIPALSFLFGTVSYFTGKAALIGGGYYRTESLNLDREYRARSTTSGCRVTGIEFFTDPPNNLAVIFWTKILGFQRGVYHGFYPDKAETAEILSKKGRTVDFTSDSLTIKFSLEDKNYILHDPKLWHQFYITTSIRGTAQAAIVDDQLIIFKSLPDTLGTETDLADLKTGGIFAKYIQDIEQEKKNGT